MSNDANASREKLWDLIKDIRYAMFTTSHPNGHLHAQPMTTQNRSIDEDDSVFFFMSKGSDTFAGVQDNPQVNLAYADTDKDTYVSVSGSAEQVDDLATKQRLWSKMNEAWFPKGPTDPDVALVRVRVTHADYWDVKASKPVQLLRMAKAAVTGQPPKNMGDHGQIRM